MKRARRLRRPSAYSSIQRPRHLENLEDRRVLTDVSGTIDVDTVWSVADSPYTVVGDVTVSTGAELEIEPGVLIQFENGTGITVQGRLNAKGTPFDRIRFEPTSPSGRWDGLSFENTLDDSRVTFADMHRGDSQGEAILVNYSRLYLEGIVWTGTTGTILELEHPSLIVRDSHFPTSDGAEVIHGEHIENNEYLIIDGNVFENSNNGGDVIDILERRPPWSRHADHQQFV
ncbi:MAG: hypothetical protein R3C28_17800 [Pirellulaceae bacterium]